MMQATATKTSFHIGETTITIPLTAEIAQELDDGLSSVLQTFKDKEQATRPKRWESLDWKHKGDLAAGGVHLEVFCNPNAYANAFQAKVLITAKDDRMQVTAEGQLSALKADISTFLESQ
ncbi:hypothetical protein KFL_000560170 [Klebsormidium nitens]|uniref:Uncharacterized protein n=1 Tax=Klebsormidium nitens TaxID=105231 RepID=A0A1Y1HVG5_KLENI|nr:hypothetical protein KFL_000560170 [Klebsormidium nitens]|eukprot:GAQ80527.1 hypothetical protein KFL_000560170 [Klebsormidium nitens]